MLQNKYKIVGLVTCFNRVNTTLAFLQSFFDLELDSRVELSIYILDDGSSDNSFSIISQKYPSVHIKRGAGANYWAGGMRLVFQTITDSDDKDYTHLFVLNDDIILKPSALKSALIELEKAEWHDSLVPYAAVMTMFDLDLKKVVYGGLINQSRFGGFIFDVIEPTSVMSYAETLNMNAVLISRGAIDKIGFLDRIFAHHRADIDFGFRLTKSGGRILVLPGIHGFCTLNSFRSFNYYSESNLFRRLRLLLHPKNEPLLERFIFYSRHSKNLGLFLFFVPYMTILFPKLRNSRSRIFRRNFKQ